MEYSLNMLRYILYHKKILDIVFNGRSSKSFMIKICKELDVDVKMVDTENIKALLLINILKSVNS